jgi:hypothetical protein
MNDIFKFISREWTKRISAEQARSMYERCLKQEHEFAQSFTGLYIYFFIVVYCSRHTIVISSELINKFWCLLALDSIRLFSVTLYIRKVNCM